MSAPFKGLDAARLPATQSTWVGRILSIHQLPLLPRHLTEWKKLISSISISLAIHGVILFVLSWFYFNIPQRIGLNSMLTLVSSDGDPLGEGIQIDLGGVNEPINVPGAAEPLDTPLTLQPFNGGTEEGDEEADRPGLDQSLPSTDRNLKLPVGPTALKSSVPAAGGPRRANSGGKASGNLGANNTDEISAQHADHFQGRGGMAKGALLKQMGGTDASEAAVARGLEWLKNHQLNDGSWNFNHLLNPRCDCTEPGRLEDNPNASTAMALLAFLGAGHTHQDGLYKLEVQRGIDFLLSNFVRAPKGICFYPAMNGQPMFYTHGLSTIALSEAYAMTGDMTLRQPIVGAIDFLIATQEAGGGWRYFPGQPGDTSVVAWELMALKSAQFSRIQVPQKVFRGVERFLGSVSSMRGSQFAYTPDRQLGPTPSMTAAGLLCKMYLNAKEGPGGLQAGVRVLSERGPDPDNMYYNYYATQVMHHWGGIEWDRWNNVMREHLIYSQIPDGHARGSWNVADRHGQVGGRLYMTSLALLTLEVYYRHLPLYHRDRIEIPLLKNGAEDKNR